MRGMPTAAHGDVAAVAAPAWRHVSLGLVLQRLGPFLSGSVLPFVLVLYLALKGGGYDVLIYGEVGIAVWWLVLLGALVGMFPAARIGKAGWLALGLLIIFAAWTALGIGWSESAEQSVAEVGRVTVYLGVFSFALLAQGREGLPRTVNAVALAIAVVSILALLSRLHPAWFPGNETAHFLPETRERLNYPLNYWNGLAALLAIGIPLVLRPAVRSSRLLLQGLATAAVPVMVLTAFYTLSRGGALEIAVGLLVFLALYPRRLEALTTLLLAAAGSAVLIASATQRDALEDGLRTAAARSEGDEMLAVVLVVCVGAALIRVAIGLAARHGLGPRVRIPPAEARITTVAVIAVGAVIALAAGLPGELSGRWEEFKQPAGPGAGAERFQSSSGNGRYQYWESALDANATAPLNGIGAGSYQYWWAREGTLEGFVRDAHSLYTEALGELGIVGLVLLGGVIGSALAVGTSRALRASSQRSTFAAATAASAAFAVAAAVDWVWEIAVIPVAFFLLAGAMLGEGRRRRSRRKESGTTRPLPLRLAIAALAIGSILAIAIPMAGAAAVRDSQEAVRASRLQSALEEARNAERIQPYAAGPSLQEALVLERMGDVDAAADAAHAATEEESTNWRTWFVLSRLEAMRGKPGASIEAYREARSLNPRSPLFP
jgi:hypothetical protein